MESGTIKTIVTKEEEVRHSDKYVDYFYAEKGLKEYMMKTDPTIFAFALFRNNDGSRLKLYPFQDLIINDKSKNIAVAVARQTGKSTLAVILAFWYIFYNPNFTVLLISKTKDQSMELITKLRGIINTSPLKHNIEEIQTGADNRREFYLKNHGKETHSRIISVPATDAARGYSADLVIADEIAFWENSIEIFNEAILPTVTHTDGTIMMLSTPKSKIGVFYEAFTQPDIWSCYQFTWEVCPVHTKEKMDVKKRQIGEFSFRQEYEASFVANEAAYFREREIKDAIDDNLVLGEYSERLTVVGVDFGKINDPSVIIVGCIENPDDHYDYQRIKIIDVVEKPLGTEYNKVVGELRGLLAKYKPVNIIYDETGVGEAPGDFMGDLGMPVEGLKFSIQSKVNIYSNLKILFEKRQIKIPNLKKLTDQLLLFEYEYTTAGNLKLHHPEGGQDDYCDALALLAYGLKRPGTITPGVTRLG